MPLPVSSFNSNSQNWNTLNNALRGIEKEQVTKTFKQPGGHSIVQGKLSDGNYGILLYDSSNVSRILVGFHPVGGQPGIYITKDNKDVIEELNA